MGITKMRKLEEHVSLKAILELSPERIGEFCENALDADTLLQELEEDGPFAQLRGDFCEFLEIGESTLSGWLKTGRVPRAAKVAYVLLVGLGVLQAEVRRLRQDARELKIIRDGQTFQIVRFDTDEMGVSSLNIVARDIADAKTARVLAGSMKAFRMLQEVRDFLDMVERPDWAEDYQDLVLLKDLDTRIMKETLAAFEPDKWNELFGPIDSSQESNDFIDEEVRRMQARENYRRNITLERASRPIIRI